MSATKFSISQSARLSGLTVCMLDYLCRTGVLIPSESKGSRGRGKMRYYSFGDLVLLRVIARLLKSGVSVARVKSALATLRDKHPEITRTSIPSKYLITDGETIYFADGSTPLESLPSGQLTFAFVLEIDSIRLDLANDIDRDHELAS